MLGYLDSSVALRHILNEPEKTVNLKSFDKMISSELLRLEVFRTLDRYRIQSQCSERFTATAFERARALIAHCELIRITPGLLQRAAQPVLTSLGTLDALHLFSCLLFQEVTGQELTLCTHDESLKRAAIAMGVLTLNEREGLKTP